MTFTYTEDLSVDRDYVRFYTGDVVSDESFLSDEIITSLLATYTDTNEAVLAAFDFIIRRLSQPNFTADWLRVDFATAVASYRQQREQFAQDVGAGVIGTSSTVFSYRADSKTTEEPDYTYGRGSSGWDNLSDDDTRPTW